MAYDIAGAWKGAIVPIRNELGLSSIFDITAMSPRTTEERALGGIMAVLHLISFSFCRGTWGGQSQAPPEAARLRLTASGGAFMNAGWYTFQPAGMAHFSTGLDKSGGSSRKL